MNNLKQIPKAHKMSKQMPLRQGSLDSLCGVYAVMNVVHYLTVLNEDDRVKLFGKIIRILDGKSGSAGKIITSGTYKSHIRKMIKVVRPFIKKMHGAELVVENIAPTGKNLNIRGLWSRLNEYFKEEDEYRRIALIGLSGKYEHWTCAIGATEKQLKLYDSDSLKRLNYCNCTTGETDSSGHQIDPSLAWGFRLTK